MEEKYQKLVQGVIKAINWNKVKHFHKAFEIKWQFEEEKGAILERYPLVDELKDELRSLLDFVITKNMKSLDYGNWIIFWKDEKTAIEEGLEGARLEAIFSLEDSLVIDNDSETNSIELLEKQLSTAVEIENYEKAAKIRDKISMKKNLL